MNILKNYTKVYKVIKKMMSLFTRYNNYLFFISLYVVFNVLLINKFFPITEGWFQDYSRYMMEGQIPYKDFYVPVPPGFIYLSTVLRSFFGDTFIYYRIYGLIERIILVTIVYFILKKIYPDKIVFVAMLTGSVVYIANVQDIFYGYYQSSFLFSIIVLYIVIRMFDNYNLNSVYYWSSVFGLFSVISFVFKQTIGGLLPIVLGIVFVFLTMRKNRRKTFLCGVISFFSAVSILAIIGYVLSLENALLPCIEQIFRGAQSKGNFSEIFFGFIPRLINNVHPIIVVICSLFFIIYAIYKNAFDNSVKKRMCLFSILFLEVVLMYVNFFQFLNFGKSSYLACFFILLGIVIIFANAYIFVSTNDNFKVLLWLSFSVLIGLSIIASVKVDCFFDLIFNVRDIRQSVIYCLFLINIIWLFVKFYQLSLFEFNYRESVKLLVLSASFSIMYAHGLSHIIEDHGTMLIVTLIVCQILNVEIDDLTFSNIIKSCVVTYCILTVFSIFSQRCYVPYVWWGVNVLSPIFESKIEYNDPNLKGLFGNTMSVNALNRIYSLIEVNKRTGDTMYTFPHINYFNVMSGLNSPTFAKVHYFDVCPDFIIERDLEALRENPPKFVLLQIFSDDIWLFHEKAFRSGRRSAQRKIVEFYRLQIMKNNYKLIETVSVDNSDKINVLIRTF